MTAAQDVENARRLLAELERVAARLRTAIDAYLVAILESNGHPR